jgi:hypothetical protein
LLLALKLVVDLGRLFCPTGRGHASPHFPIIRTNRALVSKLNLLVGASLEFVQACVFHERREQQ